MKSFENIFSLSIFPRIALKSFLQKKPSIILFDIQFAEVVPALQFIGALVGRSMFVLAKKLIIYFETPVFI